MKKVFKTVKTLLLCGVVAMSLSSCDNDKNNDPQPADDKDKTDVVPTEPETPAIPKGFVDLGLSVYWAECNLGAGNPWESGDYLAWGELFPKSLYKKENSKTYDKSILTLNYNDIIDEFNNLTAACDAATYHFGNRMPKSWEIEELIKKCRWKWTDLNDVKGYQVVGPNGNSIFLPAAGMAAGEYIHERGTYGAYWSSTACEGNENAFALAFRSDDYENGGIYRCTGMSVRPVKDK